MAYLLGVGRRKLELGTYHPTAPMFTIYLHFMLSVYAVASFRGRSLQVSWGVPTIDEEYGDFFGSGGQAISVSSVILVTVFL